MDLADSELSILEKIYSSQKADARLTQRELAHASGLSLGMTNALVRRFAELGWVKLTRLSSKSVIYALTPEGVAEIAKRAAGHFQRAARNADLYRDKVEAFVMDAKARGFMTLVLAGTSDMDFLLEYVCERHGIAFIKSADRDRAIALGKRPDVILVTVDGRDELGVTESVTITSLITDVAGLTRK